MTNSLARDASATEATVCGDAETTSDAVQAAWAAAWRRLGSLRDPTQVRAWLVAIAANEVR